MKKQQRMKEVRRKRRIMFTVLAVCIFCLTALLGGIKLKQAYDRKQEEKARIDSSRGRTEKTAGGRRKTKAGGTAECSD